MTRTSLLLVIIKINKNVYFYMEAGLHTLLEFIIVIQFVKWTHQVISSISRAPVGIPESSTSRKYTELTQIYDQSNREKKKTQMKNIQDSECRLVRDSSRCSKVKDAMMNCYAKPCQTLKEIKIYQNSLMKRQWAREKLEDITKLLPLSAGLEPDNFISKFFQILRNSKFKCYTNYSQTQEEMESYLIDVMRLAWSSPQTWPRPHKRTQKSYITVSQRTCDNVGRHF